MYDDCAEIDFTSGLGTVSNQPWHRFTGFGVSLTFNLGGIHGIQSFDVRMPTSCQRDTFLTTLMHSRSRDAESLSLPLLGRPSTSKCGLDRDDTSSNSSGSGSRSVARRKKASKREAHSTMVSRENLDEPKDFGLKSRTSSAPNLVNLDQTNPTGDGEMRSDNDRQKLYTSASALTSQASAMSNPCCRTKTDLPVLSDVCEALSVDVECQSVTSTVGLSCDANVCHSAREADALSDSEPVPSYVNHSSPEFSTLSTVVSAEVSGTNVEVPRGTRILTMSHPNLSLRRCLTTRMKGC
jgi:hypothetical protein